MLSEQKHEQILCAPNSTLTASNICGTVFFHELETGELVNSFDAVPDSIDSLSFYDDDTLILLSKDQLALVENIRTTPTTRTLTRTTPSKRYHEIRCYEKKKKILLFGSSGQVDIMEAGKKPRKFIKREEERQTFLCSNFQGQRCPEIFTFDNDGFLTGFSLDTEKNRENFHTPISLMTCLNITRFLNPMPAFQTAKNQFFADPTYFFQSTKGTFP